MPRMATITFLGAAGTVTGSRFLVRAGGSQVLVDAGLFQGLKELRLRNWARFPVAPSSLDAIVLTHAHVDHAGALPLLAREGFRGEVHCTPATLDLARLLLPDSGRLQEEEARHANRHRWSKHAPDARPLYSEADALRAVTLLSPLRYGARRAIAPGVALTFHRAGHILGSATALLDLDEPGAGARRVLFSGDLGRHGAPILPDPDPAPEADAVVVESTYGDRRHAPQPRTALRDVVRDAVARGGALLVPAFAIGRTQELLYELRALEAAGEIPELPVFVDSPMAVDATSIHLAHREDHDRDMVELLASGVEPLRPARLRFARSPEQSKAINAIDGPCIVLSASGMATGGRVLHHLKRRLPDPRTTVLFAGFQAAGTRGWSLLNGARTLRIHGEDVPVAARVTSLSGYSAHGDRDDVDRWLATLPRRPARTFCVHGEASALAAARARLEAEGHAAVVPRHLEEHAIP
jgi:metallo-beta-lactamase family protein